ncbi:MAG: DUF3857 domain-containing protein [Bacteroidota bacterium]
MKKLFFLLYACWVNSTIAAQKNLPAFGEIDIADLQMKSCSFEPDASAMRLFDFLESEYEPLVFGDKIRTERRVRIKIFNEKGYPYATIKIPYYNNKRKTSISELKGIIYSLDGSGNIISQKIEEADFFKEKAMEKVGMLRFTFPNLKPGSVIEYTYTLTEKNRLQFDTWFIQSEIPALYVTANIIIPTFSRIRETIFGNDTVSQKIEKLSKGLPRYKYIFYKEKVRSFQPEPFLSSPRDYLLRVGFMFFAKDSYVPDVFSSASLWKIAANLILESRSFTDQFNKEIPGTEKIIDTASTIINSDEKISYIYNAVKKRLPEKMEHTAYPQDIEDAWKSRSGSTAEINMILINLLKRSNIHCFPVLVSTRENGKINIDFPNLGQFNGMDVLVYEGNSSYLIDASLKFQTYDIPPLNILNRQGLLLDPNDPRWIMITDDRPLLKQNINIFGMLTEDGKIEGSASIEYDDYAKSLALDSTIEENDNKSNNILNKKISGLKILSSKTENINNSEPLLQNIEFDLELQQTGDFYYVNPNFFSDKNKNPFTKEKRETDIDFGCNQEFLVNMQLELPASFQIENLPKNIIIRSPDSSFAFTRIASFDHSNISFSQKLEIKKAIFDKEKYAGLYEFFNQINTQMAEEIILKKKN